MDASPVSVAFLSVAFLVFYFLACHFGTFWVYLEHWQQASSPLESGSSVGNVDKVKKFWMLTASGFGAKGQFLFLFFLHSFATIPDKHAWFFKMKHTNCLLSIFRWVSYGVPATLVGIGKSPSFSKSLCSSSFSKWTWFGRECHFLSTPKWSIVLGEVGVSKSGNCLLCSGCFHRNLFRGIRCIPLKKLSNHFVLKLIISLRHLCLAVTCDSQLTCFRW